MKSARRNVVGGFALAALSVSLVFVAAPSWSATTLTPDQARALADVEAAFESKGTRAVAALSPEQTVPKLKNWYRAEIVHEIALAKLAKRLPQGACRTAISNYRAAAMAQNDVVVKIIADYTPATLGLVAQDAFQYAVGFVRTIEPARQRILDTCGVSVVKDVKRAKSSKWSAAQLAEFAAVRAAYDRTVTTFDNAFTLAELGSDAKEVYEAGNVLRAAIDAAVASVDPGPCKSALVTIQSVANQQGVLQAAIVKSASEDNLVATFTALGRYAAVNTASAAWKAARAGVVTACASTG